ncbi:phosphotransferase system, EIIC [Peptoniphilus duerdenii ATCC BAA-1640]|uniref:Phosphotransferase system, EIIC n=1 Tax=Peptoniphilus duerdenii ATCC BAA-1640 TaxID=862517 RepID=E0NKY3_9FIRM|nr:PTS sugar transporter subunit IIC [Peptoniphilus duerdenii]EFM25551.1 phosphotransferase system, EIIC [Peptoniphilus duerdenii ATCC BAA-1640]
MNKFLNRKKVNISFKTYFIDAMGAMAYGLFASLLVGTILNTIGQEFNIEFLSKTLWPIVQAATGPAIAVSIAYSLNAPDLVLFSSAVVGVAGYQLGGPIGVFISTIFAVEFGKLISKETKIDIVLTPVVTVLVGAIIATFIGPYIQAMMVAIGNAIMAATKQQPLIMGVIVSVAMGMILTLPISSAAICIMLGLSGLAGGAATVGCCANMIGFAVISYKDNGFEGLLAQGIGTSMLQMPNIIRKPVIWLPSIIASAILGPISTIIFKMENTPLGSGMGTCGFVGQIGTINAMESISKGTVLLNMALLHFILPAIISYVVYLILKNKGIIRDGDMKLN